MASVSGTFLGLDFGHFLGKVAQVGQFGADGLHGRKVGIRIAFLDNQLPSDFGRAEPGIQAVGAKLGIGLTLAIDNALDIGEEVGQMDFDPLAATGGKSVLNRDAAFEFACALANCDAAPPQFTFRPPLTTRSEFFDRASHKDTAGTAFEGLGCVDEECFE